MKVRMMERKQEYLCDILDTYKRLALSQFMLILQAPGPTKSCFLVGLNSIAAFMMDLISPISLQHTPEL